MKTITLILVIMLVACTEDSVMGADVDSSSDSDIVNSSNSIDTSSSLTTQSSSTDTSVVSSEVNISSLSVNSSSNTNSSLNSSSESILSLTYKEVGVNTVEVEFFYNGNTNNKLVYFKWNQSGSNDTLSFKVLDINDSKKMLELNSIESNVLEYSMRLCEYKVDCSWSATDNWVNGSFQVTEWKNSSVAQGSSSSQIVHTMFLDSRDSKWYKSLKIGSYTWMTQDLNFGHAVIKPSNSGVSYRQKKGQKYCPNNESKYCNVVSDDLIGGLYEWHIAMDLPESCHNDNCDDLINTTQHQGICPEGWHLPNEIEFTDLMETLGDETTAGRAMKSYEEGAADWNKEEWNDGNTSGFSAKPSGNVYGIARGYTQFVSYWESGQHDWYTTHAQLRTLHYQTSEFSHNYEKRTEAHAVRCVKNY